MFFDYKTQLQIQYKKTRYSGTSKIKKLILNLYLSIFLILLTKYFIKYDIIIYFVGFRLFSYTGI